MKISFSKGKKLIAIALVSALLLTALPMTLSASALTYNEFLTTEPTAIFSSPNTKVYSEDSFTLEDYRQHFTKSASAMASSVVDGELVVPNGGNTRASLTYHKTASLNQYAKVVLDGPKTSAGTTLIWTRMNLIDRGTASDNIVPIGYNLRVVYDAKNYVTLHLWKNTFINNTYAEKKIGQTASFHALSGNDSSKLDVTVEMTVTFDVPTKKSVIKVTGYKSTNLAFTATFEDDAEGLQGAGYVGIASNGASSYVKEFAYHSTDDNVAKDIFKTYSFADKTNWFNVVNNNKVASVADGKLTIEGGSMARNSAIFYDSPSVNQYVSATFETHKFTNEEKTEVYYEGNDPVLWLKGTKVARMHADGTPNGETYIPAGYFVKVTFPDNPTANTSAQITLLKQTVNENNVLQGETKLRDICTYNPLSSDGKTYYDVRIEGSVVYDANGTATIKVRAFKGTYQFPEVTVTDTDAKIAPAGYAGVSALGGAINCTHFENQHEVAAVDAYIAENSARADGIVMFGNVMAIDPTKNYELSVLVDGDIDLDPLFISYQGNKNITLTSDKATSTVDANGYKRYTFDVVLTDAGTNSATYYLDASDNKTYYTVVIVGFKMIDASQAYTKYTDFALREVLDNGDTKTYGSNLITNGDFKMGLFGWSADLGLTSYQYIGGIGAVDTKNSSSNRVYYFQETNKYNYLENFIADAYLPTGEQNGEGIVDICDLVYMQTNWDSISADYDIYVDTNKDGKLSLAEDIAALRTLLLNLGN